MKKSIYFTLVAIIALLSACNGVEDVYNPEAAAMRYNASFEKEFGKIASNHDWGFDLVMTRGQDMRGNLWYQDWVRPVNVTDNEKSVDGDVVKEFSKVYKEYRPVETISYENYWIQQVYKGEKSYTANNGDTFVGSDKMGKLLAYNNQQMNIIRYWPYEYEWVTLENGFYEDVNNFVNGNNIVEYTDDVTKEKYYGTTLMTNMGADSAHGSTQFGYFNSTDSQNHFEYIVLKINGYYYIGFDFYANGGNPNQQADRDYIYNDWIVRITPAKKIGEDNSIEYEKRIICEDMGATGDWDFNDVVFDACIKNGKTYIKLLAAGGTIRLEVCGKEVHEMFGVQTSTMVNTGIGETKEPVEFDVSTEYNSYADIPIIVMKEASAGNFTSYELKLSVGNAPQKIAVGTDYEWCAENESIDRKYPRFPEYVGDPNLGYRWYRDVD